MLIAVILLVALPFFISANIALWIFGVRPYIHRHGQACSSAANWGWSIWTDLTTAWEIGKMQGSVPICVKLLFLLQVIGALFVPFVIIVYMI